ncbi:MAG: HupE/UreJ family protein [Pseudomonadales bacterium]|nr:HupE/UreJ family protein [Pseudomonadales bacterium]
MTLAALPGLFAAAHEIPERVQVRMFIKMDPEHITVLVRIPLESVRDIDFPQYGPGFLKFPEASEFLEDAAVLWVVDELQLLQDGETLAAGELSNVRLSVPTDRSFYEYQTALAHFDDPPLNESTMLVWRQALVDMEIRFRPRSASGRLALQTGLAHLGVKTQTVLTFIDAQNQQSLFEFDGSTTEIMLDPAWYQVIPGFATEGAVHLFSGADHLLFLICLVVPMFRFRQLVIIVTAFTAGHTITLISAALGFIPDALWFPALIEVLIAASILWVAAENMVSGTVSHRWALALIFGLVHGYGFSFQLQDRLQLAGDHLLVSLLAFNLGIEVGQLLLVVAVLGLLRLFIHLGMQQSWLKTGISLLVAHEAIHWLQDRWAVLDGYWS